MSAVSSRGLNHTQLGPISWWITVKGKTFVIISSFSSLDDHSERFTVQSLTHSHTHSYRASMGSTLALIIIIDPTFLVCVCFYTHQVSFQISLRLSHLYFSLSPTSHRLPSSCTRYTPILSLSHASLFCYLLLLSPVQLHFLSPSGWSFLVLCTCASYL